MVSPNTRARFFVQTIHIKNMIKAGLSEDEYLQPEIVANTFIDRWENSSQNGQRKAAIAVCKSATGTYHAHMCLMGPTTTLKYAAKTMWDAYTEPLFGSRSQLLSYMLKEGKYAEKGEIILYTKGLENLESHQGKRTDLEKINDLLSQGLTPKEIFSEGIQYRKYERIIKAEYIERKLKSFNNGIKQVDVEWHFGATGTSKSYSCYVKNMMAGNEPYLCTDISPRGGGFDLYAENPSDYIVLDDIRPTDCSYNHLLNLLDGYVSQIHCRYANCYNIATHILITSIYDPLNFYRLQVPETEQKTDSFQQLLRRLKSVHYHYKTNEEYKVFVLQSKLFTSAQDMKMMALEQDSFMKASFKEDKGVIKKNSKFEF